MKRLPRRRWWLLVGTLLVLVVLVHIVTAPVSGRIVPVDTKPTKPLKQATKNMSTQTLTSPYFSLVLPAGFKLQASGQLPPGLLYQQNIIKPSAFGSIIVSISLKTMPEGGLASDSSYNLRVQQPVRYQLSRQTMDGDIVSIANDSQQASVVAFWPHANKLATISLSSGLNNPASDDNKSIVSALRTLISSWQWQ
jgi:hypothetical protein